MRSFWSDDIQLPNFPTLAGDIHTDVCIIGGGITGILCAYMLHQAGINYVLVEAKQLCNGVSQNTTAKITSQHGMIYNTMLKRFGQEKTSLYLQANEEALQQYRNLCKTIDCDFEIKNNFVYSIDNPQKIEQELYALEKVCIATSLFQFTDKLPLPFSVAGAVCFQNQAQFHPLKFLAALCKQLHIYENTKVQELQPGIAITNHGTITADNIIIATHFPILNKHGAYFLKMYQHRSYVLALEHATQLNGMYIDEAQTGLSFRNYDNLLLLGGGSHRTGKHGGNWNELSNYAQTYYPNAIECYRWATQDCMPLDDIPYIGAYSTHTKGLFVATGYQKWGMTSSMTAAMLLRDMILGQENPYKSVFNPSRTMLRTQLFINAFESTKNLLTPTTKRCPHLGCALKWNPEEHSWDCPCHGSRFTEDGELIDNPATDDLKHKP